MIIALGNKTSEPKIDEINAGNIENVTVRTKKGYKSPIKWPLNLQNRPRVFYELWESIKRYPAVYLRYFIYIHDGI